jgi:hypothetical protein
MLKMNELSMQTNIENKIFTIRGMQVMLDRDLAELYEIETKVFNQAVKRNENRFPDDFRFQLTNTEKNELVTNCDRFNAQNSLRSPYVTINITAQLGLDIKKTQRPIPKNTLKKFDASHDRFLILDGKELYHIGASLKDLGKKWFAFSKFEMESFDILSRLEG